MRPVRGKIIYLKYDAVHEPFGITMFPTILLINVIWPPSNWQLFTNTILIAQITLYPCLYVVVMSIWQLTGVINEKSSIFELV